MGENLFEALFRNNVRRLYDVARSRQRGGRLNVVLTPMLEWIADLPWEFAFDPSRKTFLAQRSARGSPTSNTGMGRRPVRSTTTRDGNNIFDGRYHVQRLLSPRQVRNALRYVLSNARNAFRT